MSWATVAETANITGRTVTDATVTQAQFQIELFSGVTEEYAIPRRDLRHLKLAVAYQAAWLAGQIDVSTRTDVSQFTQDEMSATYAHEDAVVLAPLAQRALRRLSWKGSRSVQLKRRADLVPVQDPTEAFVTDADESGYRPGWGV